LRGIHLDILDGAHLEIGLALGGRVLRGVGGAATASSRKALSAGERGLRIGACIDCCPLSGTEALAGGLGWVNLGCMGLG
tara:strand:+ start:2369 stop:2608 length:240 start_codon:yes stop_codon:yes gene_type:complete